MSTISSRSDSQRKESLSYLTTAVASRPADEPLPQPLGILLPKLLPLLLDANNGVRSQLLKLLQALPKEGMEAYADKMLLYIRAGMTHLALDIRRSSLESFDWAVATCGKELVECPGGWLKTLKTFLVMLGWAATSDSSSSWSSIKASSLTGDKMAAKSLASLASFLELGLVEEQASREHELALRQAYFPLHQTWMHTIPKKSHAYRHLNLFGPPREEEDDIYGDVEARRGVFKKYQAAFEKGLDNAKRAGGDIGRAGAKTAKIISNTMKNAV